MSDQKPSNRAKAHFHRASHQTARLVGSTIVLSSLAVGTGVWIGIGAWLKFPVRWFLLTNLIATVSVFLVLLLLQHARAVNMLAIQTKLDELIRSSNAGNHLIGSHRLENESLEELRAVHRQMAEAKPH
ncbi:low affinity iron permease family protein [Rhizobium sp. 2YAF20]|uniref:low affinity iron permease family protein n=1 Tax=Rhizobium sp. 2YAF20 TaxID=3233027 RepID=UPI003F97FEDB